jgi:hypothetical protein
MLFEVGAILGAAISGFDFMHFLCKLIISAVTSKFRSATMFVIIDLQKIFLIWCVGMILVSPYHVLGSSTSLVIFLKLQANGRCQRHRYIILDSTQITLKKKLLAFRSYVTVRNFRILH